MNGLAVLIWVVYQSAVMAVPGSACRLVSIHMFLEDPLPTAMAKSTVRACRHVCLKLGLGGQRSVELTFVAVSICAFGQMCSQLSLCGESLVALGAGSICAIGHVGVKFSQILRLFTFEAMSFLAFGLVRVKCVCRYGTEAFCTDSKFAFIQMQIVELHGNLIGFTLPALFEPTNLQMGAMKMPRTPNVAPKARFVFTIVLLISRFAALATRYVAVTCKEMLIEFVAGNICRTLFAVFTLVFSVQRVESLPTFATTLA